MSESVWNPQGSLYLAQDYEGFNGRKEYADDVTGAYYANRLALVEYLEKIKRSFYKIMGKHQKLSFYF